MTAADNTAKSAPIFFEVALEGPPDAAHGFLHGLVLGAGYQSYLEFPLELGAGRDWGTRLRDLARRHIHACRAVVDERTCHLLEQLKERIEAEAGLRLADVRRVREARFRFEYRAFAPRYGQEIAALLAALPPDAVLEGGEPVETIDPRAEGLEAYAPAHSYEVAGKGAVSGRVDLVIAARRSLDTHPLLHVDALEIDGA